MLVTQNLVSYLKLNFSHIYTCQRKMKFSGKTY